MKWCVIPVLALTCAGRADATCIKVPDLLTRANFARYPAATSKDPWHVPNVRPPLAHLYRTVIRSDAVGTPDFAGHYKIVKIGCGAGTICLAIVDRLNGRVAFSPEFRSVSWILSDFVGAGDVERVTYRRDSRLLAVFGSRNEDERTGGITFYDLRDGKPRLVRFIPAGKLCREDAR